MSDPAKLMTEAKAVLKLAKIRLSDLRWNYNLNGGDDRLIYNLTKALAAMLAQEEARWGKDWLDTLPPTGA